MIKKFPATITEIRDLSKTAKEVIFSLPEPLDFMPGHFVNVHMNIQGELVRRAYTISSSNKDKNTIALSIRLKEGGKMTPIFWEKDLTGTTVELMGPLGLNTADKMHSKHIYLFGFGVGAGVIRSFADYFKDKDEVEHITIITGSRTEDDILHKDYFDALLAESPKTRVSYVLSRHEGPHPFALKGYIQDHLGDLDFNHADVFVCGQQAACDTVVETIQSRNPDGCSFFIESFG